MIKTDSLKHNRDFQRVFRNGKHKAGKYLVVYVRKNNSDYNRLGITVSKKFGNSVQRNRLRRLIKENYRLLEEKLNFSYDIVVVSKPSKREAATPANKLKATFVPGFYDIKNEIEKSFTQLNLVKRCE